MSALSVCFAAIWPAVAAAPLEEYGKDPEISSVDISPDGTKAAMIQMEAGKEPVLLIMDLNTRKAKGFQLGDLKVSETFWSSDQHVLLYASQTRRMMQFQSSLVEVCGVFSVNVTKTDGPKQLLVKNPEIATQSSLCDVDTRLWNDTGDVLMMAYTTGNASSTLESARAKGNASSVNGEFALYRVNGETGYGTRISRGTDSTRAFIPSPKGHVIARIDHTQRANRYRISIPKSADRLRDYDTAFVEDAEIPQLSVYGANADESALIIGTYRKNGLLGLYELSLKDGSIGQPVFEADGVDIDHVLRDPYTTQLAGVTYVKAHMEQIFFQDDLQGVLTSVKAALKDYPTITISSWDRARKTFVIFAEGPKSAGDYFTLDAATGKLQHLASVRRNLRGDNIATVTSFFYKARDAQPIQAFLTLPLGMRDMAAAKNLPLVVLPHGGPEVRDAVTFDYWNQALASRGYAVLQMNFRGSEGYGASFRDAGHREWGGKMQDDVTDGVQYAIANGLADPQRICIVGGSYGGYAALAGAAFTPNLYKCAVSINGVSDLERVLDWQLKRYGGDSASYEYWKSRIGDPSTDARMIKARSPTNAAKAVTADVLLIHGQDDTVVPFEQSRFMEDALKDAGKPVQLVKLDGEDHYLSRAKTRTEMLKALDGFLAKHLGGQVSPAN